MEKESIFWKNIQKGIEKGYLALSDDEARITYHCSREYSTSFKNPEETVRASYFAELVIDYQYPNEKIDIEVTVPRRTPSDRADIVIYEDAELKKPFLVVECKKDGITDSEFSQAIEQAFGNANSLRAEYAVVIAGNTKTAFNVAGFKPREREKNVIADIPIKYGKAPKFRYRKADDERELKVISRDELIRTLEKCHDTVWQGGKLAPTIAFDEVSKLLFCKLKDEKEGTKRGDYYKFQIGTHETSEEIFARVNSIYQAAKSQDEEVFKEDIKLNSKVVYSVVEHLQGLALNKIDLDTKGIAFERFMQDFFKGKMGQYFTPRAIVQFIIDMLSPKQDELILDPACGSGGFLLNAMDYVRCSVGQSYDEREAWEYWHRFAKNNLFGVEINEQIARVCKMNMIIHDDGHTNIVSTDSLSNFDDIVTIHKGFQPSIFDLILTNPPFGAYINRTEKDYLDNYVLGEGKNRQKTEILFLERCIEFLKPGTGRIGIVIPDSITINSTLQEVRNLLFGRTQILAIISLPGFAFSHYGANVKSSLLFLRRLDEGETIKNYSVFMAGAEKIGYTSTGKEEKEDDLIEILRQFRLFTETHDIEDSDEFNDKIYVVNSRELIGRRIDTKGYSPAYKRLKSRIENADEDKIPLSDCIKESKSGDWGLSPDDETVDEEEYQLCHVIRNTNFDNNFNLDFSDVAQRYIRADKVDDLKLSEGDILVEKSGGSPIQPVGRVAIVDSLPSDLPVVFSNFLLKIVIDDEVINPVYVYSYLKTLYQLGYMEYIQNQTTGIKNLLVDEFFSILVIDIDDDRQAEVANLYVSKMQEVKYNIEQAYKTLKESRDDIEGMIL